MSAEPLTNAALEQMRGEFDVMNAVAELPPSGMASLVPDLDALFAEDFTWVDRRNFLGAGHGDNPADWLRFLETPWEVSGQRPHWSITEVVALRGERTCAASCETSEGGFVSAFITVSQLDATSRWRRVALFGAEDRDAAIAEVERLHAEAGD